MPPESERKHWKHPRWGHGPAAWQRRPGALFFRLVFAFGLLIFLALAILAVPFLLVAAGREWDPGTALQWWGLSCLSVLALFAFLSFGMRAAFRNIASPLGEVMEAADRVAAGDLEARVPERGARDFRQLARSFNRMAEELSRADMQRRNLTADVAHELRNPLHVIQGNLEGILDGVYQSDPAHLQATLDETRLLARLVEDLRLLSLAEAGQLLLQIESVRLEELLEDVRTSFSGQAEAAEVELLVEPGQAGGPLWIAADYERMQQVLGNLVANALRHTQAGGQVRLEVEREGQEIRVTVRDDGEGISPEDLPFVFDRFWKGDRARIRQPGSGSGLGLAIARQLVRAHHGRIEAKSEPGAGTAFTMHFPASISE